MPSLKGLYDEAEMVTVGKVYEQDMKENSVSSETPINVLKNYQLLHVILDNFFIIFMGIEKCCLFVPPPPPLKVKFPTTSQYPSATALESLQCPRQRKKVKASTKKEPGKFSGLEPQNCDDQSLLKWPQAYFH
jgi:hypothetical protein